MIALRIHLHPSEINHESRAALRPFKMSNEMYFVVCHTPNLKSKSHSTSTIFSRSDWQVVGSPRCPDPRPPTDCTFVVDHLQQVPVNRPINCHVISDLTQFRKSSESYVFDVYSDSRQMTTLISLPGLWLCWMDLFLEWTSTWSCLERNCPSDECDNWHLAVFSTFDRYNNLTCKYMHNNWKSWNDQKKSNQFWYPVCFSDKNNVPTQDSQFLTTLVHETFTHNISDISTEVSIRKVWPLCRFLLNFVFRLDLGGSCFWHLLCVSILTSNKKWLLGRTVYSCRYLCDICNVLFAACAAVY